MANQKPIDTSSPQSNQTTAQAYGGAGGPSLTVAEETKMAYAPSHDDAIKFLTKINAERTKADPNSGFIATHKTYVDDEGKAHSIAHTYNDIYLVPIKYSDSVKEAMAGGSDVWNDFLDNASTKVGPGFIGGVVHETPYMLGGTIGGAGGAALGGLSGNPAGILAGGSFGAGMGTGGADIFNQSIQNKLWNAPGTELKTDWKSAGKQAMIGAAADFLGRGLGILAPETSRSTSVGEKTYGRFANKELMPYGEEMIDINKLMKGTKITENAERAKMHGQIKKPLERAKDLIKKESLSDIPEAELGSNVLDKNNRLDVDASAEVYVGDKYGAVKLSKDEATDVENYKIALQTIKDTLDELRRSSYDGYINLNDNELLHEYGTGKIGQKALQTLENRLSFGRGSGASWEDLKGIAVRDLIKQREMIAKMSGIKIDSTSAKQLEELVPQFGDIQTSMKQTARHMPKNITNPEQLGYTAPANWSTRGNQLMGSLGTQATAQYGPGTAQGMANAFTRMFPPSLPKDLAKKLRSK